MIELIQYLAQFDLTTILGMVGISWFFCNLLRNDMRLMREDMKDLKEDIKILDNKFNDIDKRLCRMEGAFSAKDCCILKHDQSLKKAE